MAEYTAYLEDAVTDGVRGLILVPEGISAPADHTSIGTFEHDGSPLHKTHAIYHHVRDLLYPMGILDMQRIIIKYDDDVLPISYELSLYEVTLEVGEEVTVNIFEYPGNANQGMYQASSSSTETATVAFNSEQKRLVITGVDVGGATIAVEHSLMDMELEVDVTVIAAT